jgi:DNA polymerase-3 subunit epsilon
MRQIALDTETTGLSTEHGHRIIEIGCVEIINRKLTGNTFHYYIDPQRTVDAGAYAIHGISNDFLQDKPKFNEVVAPLLEFIEGAELIIHNATFDVGFLNYELKLAEHARLINDYCSVFDTLLFARQIHPGQKNNLDALCRRYDIDNSHRQSHGALLDADLLARLYLAMTGGQGSLFAESKSNNQGHKQEEVLSSIVRNKPLPVSQMTDQEQDAHLQFVEMLKKTSGASLWEEE